jgi:4-methylaminobutanoate oxidase (formaldehyde-forming)
MDMSFMSKFLVQGFDAGEYLNYLCTANVDGDANKITYSQMLNSDGLVEADVTVIKQSDDKFLVIATDTMHRHVETWLKKNIDFYFENNVDKKQHVFVTDVTSGYAQVLFLNFFNLFIY